MSGGHVSMHALEAAMRSSSAASVESVSMHSVEAALTRSSEKAAKVESVSMHSIEAELRGTGSNQIFGVSCMICATDGCQFVALGKCDHAICTICALRLRVKNKEKCCAVCRQELDLMVVVSALSIRPFVQYEVSCRSEVQQGVMEYDHPSGLVFIECRGHYKEMEAMRSNICPRQGCGQRFPSEQQLTKHLKSAHSGMAFCPLCLEHQSLFISEQRLYTEAQLKAHLKAPPGKDKDSGHPLCLFCDKRFFDAQALYKHMRGQHETCALCPVEHQHRFYANMAELDEHLRAEHIVCSMCREPHAVAFLSNSDYSEHMAGVHGVRGANFGGGRGGKGKFNIGSGRGGRRGGGGRWLDFDISSDDPTGNARLQRGNGHSFPSSSSSGGGGSGGGAGGMSAEDFPPLDLDPALLVPAGYRIAGTVTGSGTFSRGASAAALEAASEAAHAVAAERARRAQAAVTISPADFPSLSVASNSSASASTGTTSSASASASAGTGSSVKSGGAGAGAAVDGETAHPLSIFHSSRIKEEAAKQAKLKADREREQEQRQAQTDAADALQRRNAQLHDALGLGAERPPPANPADPLSAFLRQPLYTPYILQWAKRGRGAAELPRIEKALMQLVQTQQTSLQLKPMEAGVRTVVHMLARYYGINSQEFDYEPRRYVSLVRAPDSQAPTLLLSAAALSKVAFDFAPLQLRTLQRPTLFFSIINGYFQRLQPGGASGSVALDRGFSAHAPCVSMIVQRVKTVLARQGLGKQCALSGLTNAGPEGVGLDFRSFEAAAQAYDCLRRCEAPAGAGVGQASLLDLFDMEPAFDPAEYLAEEATAAGAADARGRAALLLSSSAGADESDRLWERAILSAEAQAQAQAALRQAARLGSQDDVPDDWLASSSGDEGDGEGAGRGKGQGQGQELGGNALEEAAEAEAQGDARFRSILARPPGADVPAAYRRLELQPRSLPPPLPPMPTKPKAGLLLKRPPTSSSSAKKNGGRERGEADDGGNFNAFLLLGEDEDEDEDEDESDEEGEGGEEEEEEEQKEERRGDDDSGDAADHGQQPLPDEKKGEEGWACEACTFVNLAWEAPICAVCETPSENSIRLAFEGRWTNASGEDRKKSPMRR